MMVTDVLAMVREAEASGMTDDLNVRELRAWLVGRVDEVQHDGFSYAIFKSDNPENGEGAWTCSCLEHDATIHTATKSDARWAAQHPGVFCGDCVD